MKQAHEQETMTREITLMKRLCRLQMKENENLETHINLICELVQQLRDLGATIEDRWMIAILLSSLPDYFDNVADTLEARSIRDLTWGIVTAKLLDANNRRKERSGSIEKMERLLLTKGTAREAPICNYCQKPNHIEKFCRIKKADKKRERKSIEDEQIKVMMREVKEHYC